MTLFNSLVLSAMEEFKDQIDKDEAAKVQELISKLRELIPQAASGESTVTSDEIRTAIEATQKASLTLFQKVSLGRVIRSSSRLSG